jgi:hypothetical protein
MTLIDFSPDSSVSQQLAESVPKLKEVFDTLRFEQIDWAARGPHAPDDLRNATEPFIHTYGCSSFFWDGSHVTTETRQEGFFVFSCRNGTDKSNAASCHFGIRILQLLNARISEPTRKVDDDELVRFFTVSGNMVSNLVFGTDTLTPIRYEARPTRKRAPESPPVAVAPAWAQLFTGREDRFLDKSYSHKSGTQCVSIFPGIEIIHPEMMMPSVFGLAPSSFLWNLSDQPIVIALHRPVYVTEIVFRAQSSAAPQPATVCVSGGPYLNRLFPILSDMALLQSSAAFLKFTPPPLGGYTGDLLVNRFEPVRFLVFTFRGTLDCVSLQNIYVFGIPFFRDALPSGQFSSPATAEFDEPYSLAVLAAWEERRLALGLEQAQFQLRLLGRGLSLAQIDFESVMRLRASDLAGPVACQTSDCRKTAVFRCGMCERVLCMQCGKPHVVNAFQLCDGCFTLRQAFAPGLTHLDVVKSLRLAKMYPFVGTFQILNAESPQGPAIPARFVYEPPRGRSGVIAESVLGAANAVWDPAETMVRLTVVFRQIFEVSLVSIEAGTEIAVSFDPDEVIVFKPPIGEHAVRFTGKSCSFLVRGNPIEISRIAFFGVPMAVSISASVPGPPAKKLTTTPGKVTWDPRKFAHAIELEKRVPVFGIPFERIQGVKELFVRIEKGGDLKFLLPQTNGSEADLLFPSVSKCKGMTVFYCPTSDFMEPKITGCLIDASS